MTWSWRLTCHYYDFLSANAIWLNMEIRSHIQLCRRVCVCVCFPRRYNNISWHNRNTTESCCLIPHTLFPYNYFLCAIFCAIFRWKVSSLKFWARSLQKLSTFWLHEEIENARATILKEMQLKNYNKIYNCIGDTVIKAHKLLLAKFQQEWKHAM